MAKNKKSGGIEFFSSLPPRKVSLAMDQSYKKTGVSVLLPGFRDELWPLASEIYGGTFFSLDPEAREALVFGAGELPASLPDLDLRSLLDADGNLLVRPPSSRKKPFSIGRLLSLGGERVLLLHGRIYYEASNTPEWVLADQTASRLQASAAFLAASEKKWREALAGFGSPLSSAEEGAGFLMGLEGIALHGSPDSIPMLPLLSIIYAAIWRTMESNVSTRGLLREVPISSLKLFFTGAGDSNKKEIKRTAQALGFGRLRSDDEADAIAMAILLSVAPETYAKDERGRIRPTLEAMDAAREKKAAKKVRSLHKMALRLADGMTVEGPGE